MFQRGLTPPDPFRPQSPVEQVRTQDGMTVKALGELGSVLLVFLPALRGKPCRELLAHVRDCRGELEGGGLRLVLIHMGAEDDAREELAPYELQYLAQIADEERILYRHFEIGEASGGTRSGSAVLRRALDAVRPGRASLIGEPDQLAAALVWRDGKVLAESRPVSLGASLPLRSLLG